MHLPCDIVMFQKNNKYLVIVFLCRILKCKVMKAVLFQEVQLYSYIKFNGEGNGNPLQYSCLNNPMDRGVWQGTVQGVTESGTTERAQTHSYLILMGDLEEGWAKLRFSH